MTAIPNRISAFGAMTPQRELALARQMLEIQSEEELDRFLPLIAAALPMVTKIAGPLLKNLAGGLFGGGGGGGRRKRPRDQQEHFLGKIVKGLFGETEAESYEQEQFLGKIVKGLFSREAESYEQEQEQFLGGLIGKLFGKREMEAESENYVQEQFLGGILKGLLGREAEAESYQSESYEGEDAGISQEQLIKRARRFVRLVSTAASYAASDLASLQGTGHRPSPAELRKVVLRAIIRSASQYVPRLAAIAFPHAAGRPQVPGRGGQPSMMSGQPAPGGRSMLEMMMAETGDSESSESESSESEYGPAPRGGANGAGHASWVRQGNQMIFTL